MRLIIVINHIPHIVMLHFHHQKVEERLWSHDTYCTIHSGACVAAKRPCGTEPSVTGISHASKKDIFLKHEGRKKSLSRALLAFAPKDPSLRRAIWHAYLALSPPRTKRAVKKEVAACGESSQKCGESGSGGTSEATGASS